MKIKLQAKAIFLRQQGHSLREISEQLKISKSTASIWLRTLKLSQKAQKILRRKGELGRIRGNKTIREKSLQKSLCIDASVGEYLAHPPFQSWQAKAICAFLYGCEGAKNERRVVFINSDPDLIHFFLMLLRRAFPLNEGNFRVLMHLHEYHDEKIQKRFWAGITGIPEEQFSKTYQKKNGKKIIREGYQGCISVRYNSGPIQKELVKIYREMLKRRGMVFDS